MLTGASAFAVNSVSDGSVGARIWKTGVLGGFDICHKCSMAIMLGEIKIRT